MVTKELVELEYIEASIKYNKLLRPEKVGEEFVMKGRIDVIDEDGGYWDTYDVKIIIPCNYPLELPILIETGLKIEQHEDWHNRNGVCCLSTNAKMHTVLKNKISLLNWLEKFAHPFLANHVYRIKTGNYANKEFAHGTLGIIQGYYEILNIFTIEEVEEKLKLICGIKKINRNEPCFCCSGKKYKNCFLINPTLHYFDIPYNTLLDDLKEISKYKSKNQINTKTIVNELPSVKSELSNVSEKH